MFSRRYFAYKCIEDTQLMFSCLCDGYNEDIIFSLDFK